MQLLKKTDGLFVEKDTLATVAKTGSYNDLSNKPDIPEVETITASTDANDCIADTDKSKLFKLVHSAANIPTSNVNYIIESSVNSLSGSTKLFCHQLAYSFTSSSVKAYTRAFFKRTGSKDIDGDWIFNDWVRIAVIDDDTASSDSVYSSEKVNELISNVPSEMTEYSSQIVYSEYKKTVYTGTSLRKYGQMVSFNINMSVDVSSKTSGKYTIKIGNIPEACRPTSSRAMNVTTNTGVPAYVYIDANGNFGFTLQDTSKTITAGDGMRLCFTYFI